MYLDANLILAGAVTAAGAVSGQLVTALGNTVSTNTLDIAPLALNQAFDVGQGRQVSVEISILQTLTSAGAATVQFQLIQADDAALSANVQVINQTDAVAFASLTAGTLVPIKWDRVAPLAPKRYVGMRFVVGTAALTNATGQFFVSVVETVADVKNIYGKSGFTVA